MTSFAIDAAELNPALKALTPITRGLAKDEAETAGVCEMVYCRTTTSGELLMATADLTHKLVAAVTVPLVDFDGELAEFAIGREKLKQITAIFKPDEEANKPVVVEVVRNKVPLRGVEQVITMTEGEIDQSPSSLSFAGAKWEDLPWRETLKSVTRNRLEQQPVEGYISPIAWAKLQAATKTYGVSAMTTISSAAIILLGERMVAILGAKWAQENPPKKQHQAIQNAAAAIGITAELIEGTDPIDLQQAA
jgi:hypothetical protein|nr:MAG TPA: hypothetical protein [Caudoviricetes sp.]